MQRTLLLLALALGVVSAMHMDLRLLSPASIVSDQPILVEFTLTSDTPVTFLSWGTPFEEKIRSNLYNIVQEDGVTSPLYMGILCKRAQPEEQDYIQVTPDSPLVGTMDLSDLYYFEFDGTYTVSMHFIAHLERLEREIQVDSTSFTLTVSGAVPFVPTPRSLSNAVDYTACSSSDKNTVVTAISNAVTASQNALNYLNKNSCRATYTTWFGTYSSSNWNTIDTHFTNINAKLASNNFGIDCGCTDRGVYAYVYPTDPTYTIHLCGAFWTASTNKYSYDSQPGTLSHEMSHFNSIAGTDDWEYGTTACKALAESNPSKAINNADSHEYFQESQPTC